MSIAGFGTLTAAFDCYWGLPRDRLRMRYVIGKDVSTPEQQEARFIKSVLAASEDCIKVISVDGNLTFMSEGGQRTMEVSDFNAIKGCPWPDFWHGQGNLDAVHALNEARAGRSARFQGNANTAAGNPRYWDVQVSPIFDADGKVENILSVSRDISLLKEAEERQRLLALELKHRIKNTIAMIKAIANQSMKTGRVEDLMPTFMDRISTLSSAHDLLTQDEWASGQIIDVVHGSLRPHAAANRLTIQGPPLALSSKCALGLALGLHELATNAQKYGALSGEQGHIDVQWQVSNDVFHFVWRESGGPPVAPPQTTGFGTKLIERALAGYFRGTTKIDYDASGLVFVLDAPVQFLTSE